LLGLLSHRLFSPYAAAQSAPLSTRTPKPRSRTEPEKHQINVIWFTDRPIYPPYTAGMTQQAPQPSFQPSDDIRVDYALIAASVTAGLIALIYLILV
jgi:hypothetical protein